MSMNALFGSQRLTPAWTFSANGIIWRMVLADPGFLIGECRDPQARLASFFAVETESGNVLWKDLRLVEQWWVGLEAVHNNVILFHGFASPDMPEHRGIQAFDMRTGRELWSNHDFSFWFCHQDQVIVYRDMFERRVGHELDLQTGSLIRTHEASLQELHELRQRAAAEQTMPDAILPEFFEEKKAGEEVSQLVKKETKGKSLAGNIEYLRQGDILVFNYHERRSGDAAQPPSLENHLFVYQLSPRKRRFAEIIGRNLTGYVPDSFFVNRGHLLFVSNQRVLTALNLWKS
jgi:hypothetical protein